jgi:hypothetical protein
MSAVPDLRTLNGREDRMVLFDDYRLEVETWPRARPKDIVRHIKDSRVATFPHKLLLLLLRVYIITYVLSYMALTLFRVYVYSLSLSYDLPKNIFENSYSIAEAKA